MKLHELKYNAGSKKTANRVGRGSSTKINMARATLNALKAQRSPEHVAMLRGKKVEEILR